MKRIQNEPKPVCRDCSVMPGEDCVTLCYFHSKATEMEGVIESLLAWADYMGGWEHAAWRSAERIFRKTRRR